MENNAFIEAKKQITSQETLNKFLSSNLFLKIMDFIYTLQKSVEGKNKLQTLLPEVI
jgi:hypothetical protein